MDRWLQNLQKIHQASPRSKPPAAPEADSFLSVVFDTAAIEQETAAADPVGQAITKAQFQSLAADAIADADWNEQLDRNPRASAPGLVKLARIAIDGEPWVVGYDHHGKEVYSRPLAGVA